MSNSASNSAEVPDQLALRLLKPYYSRYLWSLVFHFGFSVPTLVSRIDGDVVPWEILSRPLSFGDISLSAPFLTEAELLLKC